MDSDNILDVAFLQYNKNKDFGPAEKIKHKYVEVGKVIGEDIPQNTFELKDINHNKK